MLPLALTASKPRLKLPLQKNKIATPIPLGKRTAISLKLDGNWLYSSYKKVASA
jgi:hypothetical protein